MIANRPYIQIDESINRVHPTTHTQWPVPSHGPARIASGRVSQRLVLPSMSVNRNVIVPVGSAGITASRDGIGMMS
jgi:hypothetical protein